jgi:hypothetical protein
MEELLKWVLTVAPFEYAIAALFLTVVLSRPEEQFSDFEEILERIAGRFPRADCPECKGIEKMKYASYCDLFEYVMASVREFFGEIVLPPFALESFISSNIVLLVADRASDVTPLSPHFMKLRNRLDACEMFTITDYFQEREIREVKDALSHSAYTILIYSKPSPQGAAVLASLIWEVPTTKGLIVVANTLEYLPEGLFEKASVVNYNSFPLVRNQMIQIFQYFTGSIRSTADPLKMKKLSFMCSLLFSVVNFRSSIIPTGFCEFRRLNEITMKELFEALRPLIEGDSGLFVRNFRDHLQNFVFGAGAMDTFDRRKLRSHIYSVFSGSIDNVNFVEATSNEGEIWKFPPDAPIANYVHFFEKYPQFTSTDLLLMDAPIAEPLRRWSMTEWISSPLLELRVRTSEPIRNPFQRFPAQIFRHGPEVNSPMQLFIRSEISSFNRAIAFIVNSSPTVTEDSVPQSWKEAMVYSVSNKFSDFVAFVNAKHDFLDGFTEETREIDVRLMSNLQGLLQALLQEASLKTPECDYELKFTPGGNGEGGFVLTNISILAGCYQSGLIRPPAKAPPIGKMPPMHCVAMPKAPKRSNTFLCPLFRTPAVKKYALESDFERVDGEPRVFIWYIPMHSKLGDRVLIANGTALICQVPEAFQALTGQ